MPEFDEVLARIRNELDEMKERIRSSRSRAEQRDSGKAPENRTRNADLSREGEKLQDTRSRTHS